MKHAWRWFGPDDAVTLDHVKQAGASGIVTALHHVPNGVPWTEEAVGERAGAIRAAGLEWSVIESIPVHEDIKSRTGDWRKYVDAFKQSVRAAGAQGVKSVCYNFMPVVDWTRTNLHWRLPTSGYSLRFDAVDFAVYDVFVLEREGAEADHPADVVEKARARHAEMSEADELALEKTIIAGLPGSEMSYSRDDFRARLAEYKDMTPDDLRGTLIEFLGEVVPVAQEAGVVLALHPDDPPFSLFGLPRIASSAEDYRTIFKAHDAVENGMTFCAGSLGAGAHNDLEAMAKEFAPRVHFAHLRNVCVEPDRSFYEAEHLGGRTDMVDLISTFVGEEKRRREAGRADAEIPIRPDHGHLLADDVGKDSRPGYSYVGRLKGLAEIRGVEAAVKALGR